MSVRLSSIAFAACCALASVAQAATLVVPNVAEFTGVNTGIRNAPRTYMALYTATNFTSLTTPVLITGMQLRLSVDGNTTVPATWPSSTLSFNNFDVQLSQASAQVVSDGEFLSSTVTFASQQRAGTVTTVRSGSLSLPMASFQNTGGTNPFGAAISFSTPYLYTPGQSLLMYLSHTGYLPSTEVQPFFAAAGYTAGVTDAIASTAGYQAASANGFSSPYIVQFTVTAVPEPGTLLMLGSGVVGLLALSRRRQGAAQA